VTALLACAAILAGLCASVRAAAPTLLRTPNFESPVRGDPDDLLLLAGTGFAGTDRVVYAAAQIGKPAAHPRHVPDRNTAESGTAPVVARASPPYAITVRLPAALQNGRTYRLWVVTEHGESSEPVSINDPRPLWFSPAYAWSSRDIAGLGRSLRVVGRNLSTAYGQVTEVRLRGPATYILSTNAAQAGARALPRYLAEARLPPRLVPGSYTVGIRRSDSDWVDIADQKLDVRADPDPVPDFRLDDPAFGHCRPDAAEASACFAAAIGAARRAGHGNIVIPPGTWRLAVGAEVSDGYVLPAGVNLIGSGPEATRIARTDPLRAGTRVPLLTLAGRNTVSGLSFADAAPFTSLSDARPVIRLGAPGPEAAATDFVITANRFGPAGIAIADAGLPIARLFLTHNEFAAFAEALRLTGEEVRPGAAFRIDDSVVRWNRFVPGSYIDLSARQGTMGSEIGAADRMDFSANDADGADTSGLRRRDDPPGFRAAFFWNLNDNLERLLVARNTIRCAGDKDGDGEALAFDVNGGHSGFAAAPATSGAGADWVRVSHARLLDGGPRALPRERYYLGQWLQVVAGPGIGQARRIIGYAEDAADGITFRVAPRWDIAPADSSNRIEISRELWQAAIVDNDVDSRAPPCRKSNLTQPAGGVITLWLPSADSVIEGNVQYDSSGILFNQSFSAKGPTCPECRNEVSLQTALEIRGNRIDGEYDWSSDCSQSGIMGFYGASPTPESPPPVTGFGVSISHNSITHADGLKGGAIDLVPSWYTGPPPGHWNLIENPLIFANEIRDVAGPPPRPICRYGQGERLGIRVGEPGNVSDAVLHANRCQQTTVSLRDQGRATVRVCPSNADSCECPSP